MDLNNLQPVSIVVVTHNSEKDINSCLQNLLKTNYPKLEIIVIDNKSTDKTKEIISRDFPEVILIKNSKNFGFAKGSNQGIKKTMNELIAVINPDTLVTTDWLIPLSEAISKKDIAICQPKILLTKKRRLINSNGKTTHFLGFEWLTDYLKPDLPMNPHEITSFSGACFLVKKEIFNNLGGFDNDFFMYYEDGDFSWRLRLAGYKILVISESVVYHDYKYIPDLKNKDIKRKFYLLERNRLMMILKNYSLRTLILISPMIFLTEIGMNIFFIRKSWYFKKFYGYFWILKNLNDLIKKRRSVQKTRVVSDKELTKNFSIKIDFIELNNFFIKYCFNPLFQMYIYFVKKLI